MENLLTHHWLDIPYAQNRKHIRKKYHDQSLCTKIDAGSLLLHVINRPTHKPETPPEYVLYPCDSQNRACALGPKSPKAFGT